MEESIDRCKGIRQHSLVGYDLMKYQETDSLNYDEELQLRRSIVMLNSKVLGLVLGFLLGLIIFVATNWLLIKGPETGPDGVSVIGPNLELLGQFFIGYTVSFLGSIVGFLYGFGLGTIAGAGVGIIYNALVNRNTKQA